jgi:hypothetical protein
MSPAQTDATLRRMIKRVLTARGTTSEHILILADWLDEAATASPNAGEATYLSSCAKELRQLAPMLAEPAPRVTGRAA